MLTCSRQQRPTRRFQPASVPPTITQMPRTMSPLCCLYRASQTATGADIVIEERPAAELKSVAGHKMAPDGINAWNPAFDVTPAGLITAIVTDKGIVRPKQGTGRKEFDMKAFCDSSAEVIV